MKYNVATVFSGSINALIGPSQNIKRIYRNKRLFEDYDISLQGPYCPRFNIANSTSGKLSIKSYIKKTLKSLLKMTTKGSWILYKITHVRHARNSVNELINDNINNDLIVFRDIDSAYEYVKKEINIPYILVLHSDGTNDMFFSGSGYPKLNNKKYRSTINEKFETVCRNASGLLFLSPAAISNFKSRFSNIECLYGYYHQGLRKPKVTKEYTKDSAITFVCVGTICRRKNQRSLIEAFALGKTEGARLVLVGDGEDKNYCTELAASLGVDKKIVFAGSTENVGNVLAIADVFVLASYDEGVPNAAVEAMSFGLPLILSDVGSCKDLIHDNGWLIKPTVDNLVKAIEEAISIYPLEKFNNYQSNSLSLYETYYTEESMCREHAKMYKKVIEARQ